MTDLIAIEWTNNKLRILDQTRLPGEEVYLEIDSYHEVAAAIRKLVIRGAPAIGLAAAYGTLLGALEIQAGTIEQFLMHLEKVTTTLKSSRPTARNLFWAIERMQKIALTGSHVTQIKKLLLTEALKIHEEQIISDKSLSKAGANLIKDGETVLTHCNAGALATGGYGTALGVIKHAFEQGKKIQVIATETRPLLQGARLTACELKTAGIPFMLITDSMAGTFMRQGKIQAVVVGADRIAVNGDTANKIGTYALAVLARAHNIPFYVAAPTSTIDFLIDTGNDIIIEERLPEEVTCILGTRIAPAGIQVSNPAFDVTPHCYITAIITEKGVIREPFAEAIRRFN